MRRSVFQVGLVVCVVMCLNGASYASDCAFYLSTIETLKAQCGGGAYCEDLDSFKARAKSVGCLADESKAPSKTVIPKANVTPSRVDPLPKPTLGDSASKTANCPDIPTDLDTYRGVVSLKYSEKLRALKDGLETLRRQRSELERSFSRQIGAPGSARESLTYIAATVKTTSDLFLGLAEFNPASRAVGKTYRIIKWRLSTQGAYQAISRSRLANEVIRDDAETAATSVLLEVADFNPVLTAIKVTRDFGRNLNDLVELQAGLDVARKEYARSLGNLDAQIAHLLKKIEEAKAASVQSGGEALFQRYMEVRSMCLRQQNSGPSINRP